MNITSLIVDDEQLARELLREYIEQTPELSVIGEAAKGKDAVEMIDTMKPDLIFLDVQMPGMTGFDVLDEIEHDPFVIFTTAYDQYAIKAFEKNAVDYLLKPISFERFLMGVNKIFQLNLQPVNGNQQSKESNPESNQPFLYLRSDRKMVKVLFNEILYVESLKDYLKIVTTGKIIITRQSISSLEQMLPKDAFLRIHRSYIVAVNRIDSYNGETIDIAKNELPIGRLFKHDVNLHLNK